MKDEIGRAELIVNQDGSIYHLHLKPEYLAGDIIIVGDPGRVNLFRSYLVDIEVDKRNRDFHTLTGYFNNKRLTILSTGIGTDNIDIVMNELDALVNIDLGDRVLKPAHTCLNIIRLGTSVGMQADVPVNTFVASTYGLGLDGLIHFYAKGKEVEDYSMASAFIQQTDWSPDLARPYFVKGSDLLIKKIAYDMQKGVTATSPGFYGPQGRTLRLHPFNNEFINRLSSFRYRQERVVNFEMETSALYGLSKMLGHNALTVCVVVANRVLNQFSTDYPVFVDKLIKLLLERLTN